MRLTPGPCQAEAEPRKRALKTFSTGNKTKMLKSILAVGYFGYNNFGDELILSIFTERLVDYKIRVVKKMAFHPIKALIEILKSDAVVFPGGSVFQDETSLRSLLFYSTVIIVASCTGKPVYLLDQGFEIQRRFSRILLSQILRMASLISVRDESSAQILQSIGLNPLKSADCAFSINDMKTRTLAPPKTIGIIPRGKLSVWKKILVDCENQYKAPEYVFAVLSRKDIKTAEKLAGNKKIEVINTLGQLRLFFKKCDHLVLGPYHAVLLAYAGGAKFIAHDYSKKIKNFLRDKHLEKKIYRRGGGLAFEVEETGNSYSECITEEAAFQIFVNLLKRYCQK